MPRGDKSKYTDKQIRQAEHIEDSYRERGLPEDEAKAGETKVQDLTDKFNRKVDEMIVVKDKDIMTI